jgi:hypothetical protein
MKYSPLALTPIRVALFSDTMVLLLRNTDLVCFLKVWCEMCSIPKEVKFGIQIFASRVAILTVYYVIFSGCSSSLHSLNLFLSLTSNSYASFWVRQCITAPSYTLFIKRTNEKGDYLCKPPFQYLF